MRRLLCSRRSDEKGKKKKRAGNNAHDQDALDSPYLCPPIRKFIQTHELKSYSASFSSTNVRLWYPVEMRNELQPQKMAAFIEKMVGWVASLRWSTALRRPLDITIYFTPYKKTWSLARQNIGPCEINSGQTDFYSDGTRKITIWRREDYHKVLLHELLHAYDWDSLVPVAVRHSTNSHVHHAEAVVEACALLLHCILLRDEGYGDVLQLLEKERQWMWTQAHWYLQSKATSTETHAYEYIVLKTALLFSDESLDWFLTWLSLPTKHACQLQWPKMMQTCLDLLLQSFSTSTKKTAGSQFAIPALVSTLSLALVHTQRALM